MSKATGSTPLKRSQAIDLYFMEHRAKLIDIASFLDRLDRAEPDVKNDFRIEAFRKALQILSDDKPDRAKRVLEHFSDPTTEPIAKAPMKGALGAYSASGGR